MDSAKNVRWVMPFKKFDMVRVNWLTNLEVLILIPLKLIMDSAKNGRLRVKMLLIFYFILNTQFAPENLSRISTELFIEYWHF